MKIMVTGGCGFIGSAVCRHLVNDLGIDVVNVDKMTYAASDGSTAALAGSPKYRFHKLDICDRDAMQKVMQDEGVDAVMHLAAESHVDRSIDGPGEFIQTNIMGTFALLQAARSYHASLPEPKKSAFRFHHISTDEVYGSTTPEAPFHPHSPYRPNSPYAASKAASDHLVRAFAKTYNLKTTLSHSCNNYGPYQHQEKFIPTIISHARQKKPIPIYGQGLNKRTWIHVDDHAEALWHILDKGQSGETYPIGTSDLISNLDLVHTLLPLIDPNAPITFVADRPGHDLAYVLDTTKTTTELNWQPKIPLTVGLEHTVNWYLNAVPV